MQIVPKQPTVKGPAEWFTGDVYIDVVAEGEAPAGVQVVAVHFAPGARSAWHAHGLGQTLFVTGGVGLVQSRGGEVRKIHAGDVVVTPSGEEHWHGAAPEHVMTHLSMTASDPERPDRWGEHVTDEEYGAR
jgi:quercetin dioxygenase-like cupin family protein